MTVPMIRLVEPGDIAEVKKHLEIVLGEVWQLSLNKREKLSKALEKDHYFDNENNLEQSYFSNRGTYLVLLLDKKIVGSGAIKYLSADTCELKRMFFQKACRQKGFAKKMWQELKSFAKNHGYKKVFLEVFDAQKQKAAISFYENLGFHFCEAYKKDLQGEVFMSLDLGPFKNLDLSKKTNGQAPSWLQLHAQP